MLDFIQIGTEFGSSYYHSYMRKMDILGVLKECEKNDSFHWYEEIGTKLRSVYDTISSVRSTLYVNS